MFKYYAQERARALLRQAVWQYFYGIVIIGCFILMHFNVRISYAMVFPNPANFVINICEAAYDGGTRALFVEMEIVFTIVDSLLLASFSHMPLHIACKFSSMLAACYFSSCVSERNFTK